MNNRELREIGYKEIKFPNGSTLIRSDEGVWGEKYNGVTITTSAEAAADELVLLVEALAKELAEEKAAHNEHVTELIREENKLQTAVKALDKSEKFISAIMSFYGQNLSVFNWHLNGEGEPWDNFFDDNMDGDELDLIRQTLSHIQGKEK